MVKLPMSLEIHLLHLSSTLEPGPEGPEGEVYFFHKLNKEHCHRIDPEGTALFMEQGDLYADPFRCASIPPGDYLFCQKRKSLARKELLDLATELQIEGLWQRLKLGGEIYIRLLHEDGAVVSQLLRPYSQG